MHECYGYSHYNGKFQIIEIGLSSNYQQNEHECCKWLMKSLDGYIRIFQKFK